MGKFAGTENEYFKQTGRKIYYKHHKGTCTEIRLEPPFSFGDAFIPLEWMDGTNKDKSKLYKRSNEFAWNKAKDSLLELASLI